MSDRDRDNLAAMLDPQRRGWVLWEWERRALLALVAERDALLAEVQALRPLALAEATREV